LTEPSGRREYWTDKSREFMAEFLKDHPALSKFHDKASVVLHGSTTMGIDDAFSDLDFWFLLSEADLAEFDAVSSTRFFPIEVDGKPGHIDARSVEQFSKRFQDCELAFIFEMRSAGIIMDHAGCADELQRRAREPMRDEVSDAFFFYHYILMRDWHQSCRNPMSRRDPVGVLLSLPEVISNALKAAIALDGQPYPYGKWLHRVSLETPTGRLLAPSIEIILDRIGENDLRFDGPESAHPVSVELTNICNTLIGAAHAKGNEAPWLSEWWFHIHQALTGVKNINW